MTRKLYWRRQALFQSSRAIRAVDFMRLSRLTAGYHNSSTLYVLERTRRIDSGLRNYAVYRVESCYTLREIYFLFEHARQ